ncbi:protein zyg-11 homolog isoform X2 [Hydra vulgaris]|uniref:Protein zyg-11 homolog isoform X2 n=1 Tax=Hydra vulgaris TaxID=6087 RepID=A0ABM4CWN5_HYDVU
MVQTQLRSVHDEEYCFYPLPLEESCLFLIAKSFLELTSEINVKEKNEFKKVRSFTQGIKIPDRLAEKLLEVTSSMHPTISNESLKLFSNSYQYNLKHLKLPNIDMRICGTNLLNYSVYKFQSIELTSNNSNFWDITTLLHSFSNSYQTLTSLKLDLHPDVSITSGTIFDFFVKFPNLVSLYYYSPSCSSKNVFTNQNWNSLMTSCPTLQVLHIYFNEVVIDIELNSAIFLKNLSLKSLVLFPLLNSRNILSSSDCIKNFLYLHNLQELDLSVDTEPSESNRIVLGNIDLNDQSFENLLETYVNEFLNIGSIHLKMLKSLDISGIYKLNDNYIKRFIESHKKLVFLGLCMSRSMFCTNGDVTSEYKQLKISGCMLEDQIIVSLLRYTRRPTYIKEVLKGLFHVCSGWRKRKPYILKIVLDIMEKYKQHPQLQMAATACVFHLNKDNADIKTKKLNLVLLSDVARITSSVLSIYINSMQMVKNCLLIICTDEMLHFVKFDHVTMCRLSLKCMVLFQETEDRHITRMAVAILSILACKIPSVEISNLIQEQEMKVLLDIVERRLNDNMIDGTLKFNLNALWNLTDESPITCKLFIDLDGLQKYVRLIETFDDDQMITKVLGLLNNIAEVKSLQCILLLNPQLMKHIRRLVSNNEVQVSYFACGIIANLAINWNKTPHQLDYIETKKVLSEVAQAVKRWGKIDKEIVTYRSFKPFYNILQCHQMQEIQRWAIWAINHVCTLCASQYQDLMSNDYIELIAEIRKNNISDEFITKHCDEIFSALNKDPLKIKKL